MAEKKSRFKKILKNLGKIAAVGAAGYGASKLFGGKAKRAANLASSYANVKDRHLSYDPRAIAAGVQAQKHDSESDMAPRKKFLGIFKKGGRVTGVAKRGFGRALMKGKK